MNEYKMHVPVVVYREVYVEAGTLAEAVARLDTNDDSVTWGDVDWNSEARDFTSHVLDGDCNPIPRTCDDKDCFACEEMELENVARRTVQA